MQQGWHTTGWPEDETASTIEPARPRRRPIFMHINRFAIAFVLLDMFSIAITLAGVRGWFYALALSAAAITLVILDARELRRHGHQVTAVWLLLTGIAYLIHRTRRAQLSAVIPVAYALTSLTAMVITINIFAAEVAEEERLLDEEAARIELVVAELEQAFPGTDGEVRCDYMQWEAFGYTTTDCTITTDGDYRWVEVTMHDDGSWTWVEQDDETIVFIP